jgi:peptidoglycan/LPS O-acetylase OafA/YrhL
LYLTDVRAAAGLDHTPFLHTWSLAVEWQFYLLWPFAVLAAVRYGRARAAIWLLAGWVILSLVGAALFLSGHFYVPYFSPLRGAGLLLGAALAFRPISASNWAGWVGLTLIATTLLVSSGVDLPAPCAWQIPLASLGAALVVVSPPQLLAWKPLAALGAISYGFYLWHMPITIAARSLDLPLYGPLSIILAIGGAAISWRYIERPFRRRPITLAAVAAE